MPFKSEKQRKFFYHKARTSKKWEKMAKKWEKHTPSGKKLPVRAKRK